MGIQNLLPFVAKACRKGVISELRCKSVAIDVSCLLHRGLFGCMEKLATGQDSKFYVYFVKKYVDALLALDCHVVLVFDGRPLPAKRETNEARRELREENVRQGKILLSQGKKDEANSLFRQSTSISREVVENTIEHFRKLPNVDILVAPYESDAQLAFLSMAGLVDAVITEDSDLIAFGCEKIFFKWDVSSGSSDVYEKDNLPSCFSGPMRNEFCFTKFRRICILTGCDYTSGLKGVGLSKASAFFAKSSNADLRSLLPRIPSYLKMPQLKIDKAFIEEFIRAEKTFLHQVVFDPRSRSQRPLTPYLLDSIGGKENILEDISDKEEDLSFAGEIVGNSMAVRLALGNTVDHSTPRLEDAFQESSQAPSWSIWSASFQRRSERRTETAVSNEEAAKKELKAGAFTVSSPVRRKKKKKSPEKSAKRNDPELITIDGEDEETLLSPSKKRTVTRPPKQSLSTKTTESEVKKRPRSMKILDLDDLTAAYELDSALNAQNSLSSNKKKGDKKNAHATTTEEDVEETEKEISPTPAQNSATPKEGTPAETIKLRRIPRLQHLLLLLSLHFVGHFSARAEVATLHRNSPLQVVRTRSRDLAFWLLESRRVRYQEEQREEDPPLSRRARLRKIKMIWRKTMARRITHHNSLRYSDQVVAQLACEE